MDTQAPNNGLTENDHPTRVWTVREKTAIELVAQDFLTDVRIAERVGIRKGTLEAWKLKPDFRAAVLETRKAQNEAVMAEGIADKQNRINRINDTRKRLLTVIDERAKAAEDEGVSGAATGTLVRQAKIVKVYEVKEAPAKVGANGQIITDPNDEVFVPSKRVELVYEWAHDASIHEELRALEVQAARELGQVIDKKDVTHRGPFIIETSAFGAGATEGEDLGGFAPSSGE